MNKGKLTVVVGGQYGSEGKGAVVAHIANEYGVHVRVGSPNAGHTIYWNGEKHVMQSIPCGWINPNAVVIIGRGALINMKLLMQEIKHIMQYYPDFLDRLVIDAGAGILDERFHEEEGGIYGEMHHRIGSTGEGVGPARIARLKRDPNEFKLFKDIADEYGLWKCLCVDTPTLIANMQDTGVNILVEGTQGSALSLLHSYWPYCTSVDTNASGIIAEVGIAPSRVTNVLMVCRTYPIRVAGNSGPMKGEITWEELGRRIGKGITPEKTTVTKKVRRIAEWDDDLFNRSCILNNPTEIALMFCDYIDPKLYGTTDPDSIYGSDSLCEFINARIVNVVPKFAYAQHIILCGTGPDTIVDLREEEKN